MVELLCFETESGKVKWLQQEGWPKLKELRNRMNAQTKNEGLPKQTTARGT